MRVVGCEFALVSIHLWQKWSNPINTDNPDMMDGVEEKGEGGSGMLMAYWLFWGEGVAFIENEREYRLFVASNFVIGEFTSARSRWVCFLNQFFTATSEFSMRVSECNVIQRMYARIIM